MWDRILQWLGYKSKCCNADTRDYQLLESGRHAGLGFDQLYCSKCNNRCDNL